MTPRPLPAWWHVRRRTREADEKTREQWDHEDVARWRARFKETGQSWYPPPFSQLARWQRAFTEREAPDPRAAHFERHVLALANKHAITVRWSATAHGGSCWPGLRVLETPQPRTAATFVRALHELSHAIYPDDLKWRKLDTGGVRICPLSEVAAWRHARAAAKPFTWTPRMHAEATRCLNTYLPHCTVSERAEFQRFIREAPDDPAALDRQIAWQRERAAALRRKAGR